MTVRGTGERSISTGTSIFRFLSYITTHYMEIQRSKRLSVRRRAAIIASALFCLCVSNSVGPRLLPLPSPSPVGNSRVVFNSGLSASPTPNVNQPNAYMQMLAGLQYRTHDRHYQAHVATHARQPPLSLNAVTLVTGLPETTSISLNSPPLSVSAGRAPPQFT